MSICLQKKIGQGFRRAWGSEYKYPDRGFCGGFFIGITRLWDPIPYSSLKEGFWEFRFEVEVVY